MDLPRTGRPKQIVPEKEAEVVRLTQQAPPAGTGTHWPPSATGRVGRVDELLPPLAGMSLVEDSSGIRHGYDRLSKSGRPLLRRLAFMLGLRAVRSDGLYRAEYQAMLIRNGGRKMPAVVAVGRRMLCLMFAIARERRAFTPAPPHAEGV